MQELKVFAKRASYEVSKTLVVLLLLLLIGGLGLIITGILLDDMIGKTIMLIVGIAAFLGGGFGIFFIFRNKKLRAKMADKPTITLEEECILRLFLLNGNEVQIEVRNIKKVYYVPRHTSHLGFIKVVHNYYNDGTLILRLVDGTNIKIACVDSIKEVRESILKLQMEQALRG